MTTIVIRISLELPYACGSFQTVWLKYTRYKIQKEQIYGIKREFKFCRQRFSKNHNNSLSFRAWFKFDRDNYHIKAKKLV